MDYIKDLIYVNKTAISRTYASIKSHWPIIFTGIAYTLLNGVIYYILSLLLQGPLYLLSGIIMAIITSSFISNYLYLLLGIINYDRLTMQDFKDGFAHFLGKIYGVLFIGYLGSLLLSLVTPILGNKSFVLNMIVSISVFILLNALPETIYLKFYNSWDSIIYSYEFMQENWFNWLLPNTVLGFILYLSTGHILSGLFNTHLTFQTILKPVYITRYLLGQLIFSFMMVYRGHLFKILSTSTRRKRRFMNKF